MNILIPHSWLLEHLDSDIEPSELQKLVSLCGPSIERIYDKEGESVYDIEVTTNRVDSMCVRGVARETAVILNQFGEKAALKPITTPTIQVLNQQASEKLPLPTVNIKTTDCKRVLCALLEDVSHTPTPDWMAKRLRQTDQQVHDSVIDITNYATHELGYPCHAFDYDKLMALGGEINVVVAEKDLPFTTLDSVTHKTVGGEIVFVNQKGEIIDLPAVMGTANSSVDGQTKRVLLWIESLDAKKVRFTSMTHAIRTTAAQLEEKGADPITAELVLARGAELYQQLCHATLASKILDIFPNPPVIKTVRTALTTITRYLGLELPTETIIAILQKLECAVVLEGEQLLVTPPSFRPDIEIQADVVEEIARIYGYQNLPSVIMPGSIPLVNQEGVDFAIETQCKERLASLGWQELYTYSMVSSDMAAASGYAVTEHLKLANPLTDDKMYLRRSLVPSLLAVGLELHRTSPVVKIFEIANTYTPIAAGELPVEALSLVWVSNLPLNEFKGQLSAMFKRFFIDFDKVYPPSNTHVSDSLLQITKLKNGWWAATILMTDLVKNAKTHPTYQPLPKYPSVIEDLTFTIPAKTGVGEMLITIKNHHPLVNSVSLSSTYQQNVTFSITYQATDRALSSLEIAPIRAAVVAAVTAKYQAQLVGSLTN